MTLKRIENSYRDLVVLCNSSSEKSKDLPRLARFIITNERGQKIRYNKGNVESPIKGFLEVKAREKDQVTYFPRKREGVSAMCLKAIEPLSQSTKW